jgi:uncharacterized protein YyaL (SSP411 family)
LSLEELMEHAGYTKSKLQALLDSGQQKLLQARNQRPRPARDEKILTAWNALAIRGLAIAAGALDRPELSAAAAAAVDFIQSHLVVAGQLKASFAAGKPGGNAYLDDYALLLDAIIELLQQRWNIGQLNFAIWLADQLIEQFSDEQAGGFFFTAHDHEQLLYRPKSFSDDAMPAGNGVAALALNRLGHLLAEPRYLQAAETTLLAGWASMQEFPHGHATLITALDEYLTQPEIVSVTGAEAADWCHAIRQVYAPGRLCFAISPAAQLPAALAAKAVGGDHTVAFVCHGTSCSEPVTALEQLATTLTRG